MNNTNEQPEVIGQIKEGFFLRIYIGDGETDTGIKFELAQSTGNGAPIVLVGKKAFLLSWDDIVSLQKHKKPVKPAAGTSASKSKAVKPTAAKKKKK